MILYAVQYCDYNVNWVIINIHKTFESAAKEMENLRIQNSDNDCKYSIISINTDSKDDIIYDYEWYNE